MTAIYYKGHKLSPCILSNKYLNQDGYAITPFKGINWKHHRLVWFLKNGKIPKGRMICHKCDIRNCINPDHLYIGTYQTNYEDMKNRGRVKIHDNWGERHGKAKLKEHQVIRIWKLLKVGRYTHVEMAKKYGVTTGAIGRIACGGSWKYLKLGHVNFRKNYGK